MRAALLCHAVALLAALGSCADAAAPRPTDSAQGEPVLRIAGRSIHAEEVDGLARHIAALQPERSASEHRRMALVNLFIPRAAIAALDRAAWERARDAARAEYTRRLSEPDSAAAVDSGVRAPLRLRGGWQDVGLATWASLREAPSGVWTGPIEEVGAFVIARRVEPLVGPQLAPLGPLEFEVESIEIPYMEQLFDHGRLELALDQAEGEWFDPKWRDLVPLLWRQRLGMR
jgi:hypothetical protein